MGHRDAAQLLIGVLALQISLRSSDSGFLPDGGMNPGNLPPNSPYNDTSRQYYFCHFDWMTSDELFQRAIPDANSDEVNAARSFVECCACIVPFYQDHPTSSMRLRDLSFHVLRDIADQ